MFSPVQLQPGADLAMLVSAINANFNVLKQQSITQVFKDEDGINRVVIGRRPDGSWGIHASGEGVDVLTATEDQLTFNSDRNLFKIIDFGEAAIEPFDTPANNDGSGSATITYPWNDVTKSPIVLAFTNSLPSGGMYLWQGISPESTLTTPAVSPMGYNVFIRFDTYVTPGDPIGSASMVCYVRNATGSPILGSNYNLKYFVLEQAFGS